MNEFDPRLASYCYYVVAIEDDSARVYVYGDTRKNRAEDRIKNLKTKAWLVRDSKQALSELPMTVLIRIVQLGTAGNPGAPKATALDRRDLVEAAYGCIWAAATRTANGTSDLVNQFQEKKNMAEKVRQMRGASKTRTKAAKGEKAPAAKAPAAKGPGRPRAGDEYAGKKLYLVGKENPRREGTHGHKSLEIIKGKAGITYEDYISAGGRRIDLKGSLETRPAQVEIK